MKKLRIAQLSTPFISVPPKDYGGTELVVANLTEELVRRGHEVTLFAPGDSHTSAKLISSFDKALTQNETEKYFSPLAYKLFWMHSFPALYHAALPFEMANEFDIIHNHLHYIPLFFSRIVKTPTLHTYHGDFSGALKSPIERMILEKYKDANWTAISESQKRNCSLPLNFKSVIHHGIDLNNFSFSQSPGDYLVWLGRITPKKGVMDAISVAKKLGVKFVIAGFINPRDKEYYEQEVKPQIDNKLIQMVGAVKLEEKAKLLANARALLYPILWEEPFGLVMIEAMATGTPVVAYRRGSIPEVVEEGKTGFIVTPSNLEDLSDKTKRILSMDSNEYQTMRRSARARVEKNFTIQAMVDAYEKVYYEICR